MARAFVAIRPPAAVLDAVAARIAPVDFGGARPTAREQWHVTIQFLGDEVDVDAVATTFDRPLGVGPGEIAFGGADTFGSARRAQVVMLKIHTGSAWLGGVAQQVAARLGPLGYVPDERAFVPHLTLARFRAPADARQLCAAIGPEPVGAPWLVSEIVFYESELRPDGARHTARASAALGQG